MSKTETMRQLNADATAQRIKQSGRNPAAGSPDAQSGSPALDRLSTAVQELHAQLLSVQSQLASWSQVVSERMAAALRTARQQDAAQQTIEMQALRQEAGGLGPGDGGGAQSPHAPDRELGADPAVSASGWARTGVGGGAAAGVVEGDTSRRGGGRDPGRGRAAALEQDVGGVAAGAGGSAALSIGVGGDDGRREGRDGGPSKAAEAGDPVAAAADLAAARAQLAASEEALERTAQQLAASAARIELQEARQREQERERVRQAREQERQRDRDRDEGAELER